MRLLLLVLLAPLLLTCAADPDPEVEGSEEESDASLGYPQCSDTCCKCCNVGKPCGNTCIDPSYACYTETGCACWGTAE